MSVMDSCLGLHVCLCVCVCVCVCVCMCVCADDVRHDVYLTLCNGLFNKGTKRADKNVQVDVEVLNEADQVIEVIGIIPIS